MQISQLDLLRSHVFGKEKISLSSQTRSRLPALRDLLKTTTNTRGVKSILITHVLHTAIEYVEAINSIYPTVGIVAVPYSADSNAIKELRNRGFNVILPSSIDETFTKSRDLILETLKKSNDPLIVQEVGGYLAKYTKEFSKYSNFLG